MFYHKTAFYLFKTFLSGTNQTRKNKLHLNAILLEKIFYEIEIRSLQILHRTSKVQGDQLSNKLEFNLKTLMQHTSYRANQRIENFYRTPYFRHGKGVGIKGLAQAILCSVI